GASSVPTSGEIELADFYGLRVKLVPDYYRLFKRTFRTSELGNMPTVNLRQIPLDYLFNAMMKRGFDLIFASVALIVLTPFMLIISVIIILDAPGPILYRPVRVGEGGKKFQCLKFRTMFENEDSVYNKKSTQIGDKRITRVGAILRKYNIDELPQFVNVLKSEMSVVGPRPHRTFLNESMQKQVGGYMIRHYIKPGITGWAQVNGWRGPTETFEQKSQRTQHDLWYIENWSFWLDLEIVSKTVFGKTSKKNAF
ncbi:MAG: exopolysaccharide biosynthesis polyprenyl glycosylphosphotransferase, partial [Flavobacteriales bacterium]